MNSGLKQLNLGESLLQAHTHRAEQTGRTVNAAPGIALSSFAKAARNIGRRGVGLILQWRKRRAAIRELQGLNDHYLKDIGLDRSRITSAVDGILENGGHPAAFIAGRDQGRW